MIAEENMKQDKRKKVHLDDLHFDHKRWASELALYKDEVKVFENRLGEIVQRNTSKDILGRAEQFQNQFIRTREVVDELNHEITVAEQKLGRDAAKHPIAINHVLFEDHTDLKDRIKINRKLFRAYRKNFYKFISPLM